MKTHELTDEAQMIIRGCAVNIGALGARIATSAVGREPPMTAREHRLLRVACVLMGETTSDEIDRIMKLVTSTVLTRKQSAEALVDIDRAWRLTFQPNEYVITSKVYSNDQKKKAWENLFKILGTINDLHESRGHYVSEVTGKNVNVLQNETLRQYVANTVKLIKENKESYDVFVQKSGKIGDYSNILHRAVENIRKAGPSDGTSLSEVHYERW